jgi:hypothetical protein
MLSFFYVQEEIRNVVNFISFVAKLPMIAVEQLANQFVILPLIDGSDWLVRNNTTRGHTITVKGSSSVKGVDIPADHVKAMFTDGMDCYEY